MAVPSLIQHVSGSNTGPASPGGPVSINGTYNLPLPNVSLSGNLLICGVTCDSTGPPTITCSDDQANAWTAGPTHTDTNHGVITAIFYLRNCPAGIKTVMIKFASHSADFVQACVSEFNNIDTTAPADGSSGNDTGAGTSANITAGSFTPSTSGDLIWQFCNIDSGTTAGFTQGTSPWLFLHADINDGTAAQYQIQPSAAAINPTMTLPVAKANSSVAMAFKSASAGTALPAGIRVLRLQHNNTKNETAATITVQQPTKDGNCVAVLQSAGGNYIMSAISDGGSNVWTRIGALAVSPDSMSIFYARQLVPAAQMTLTISMSGSSPSGNGSTLFTYELVGAAPNYPLDLGFGVNGFASANGNQDPATGSGPVDTFTAAPSGQNELILVAGSAAADTATGWTNPSYAQQVPLTYTGELNPTNGDENNPAGLGYNGSDVSSQIWRFSHDTLNSSGTGTWVVGGAAFSAVDMPTPGVPGIDMPTAGPSMRI